MKRFLSLLFFFFLPLQGISTVTRKDLETNLFTREFASCAHTGAGTNCRAENRILFRAGKHGEVSLRPTGQTAACNNINPNERLLVGIFLLLSFFLSFFPSAVARIISSISVATNFHPFLLFLSFSLHAYTFKIDFIRSSINEIAQVDLFLLTNS